MKTYTTEYSFFAGALRERICFSALLTYYLLTLLLTYLLTDILNYLLTYLLYSRVLPPAKLSNRQYGAQSRRHCRIAPAAPAAPRIAPVAPTNGAAGAIRLAGADRAGTAGKITALLLLRRRCTGPLLAARVRRV